MFDPTAFDNMKVVLEGAVYDKDLAGEIVVIDRNDFINIAKMSRLYEMTFTLPIEKSTCSRCTIILEASLDQLATELLKKKKEYGSNIEMKFIMEHAHNKEIYRKIKEELIAIWGSEREYKQIMKKDPFSEQDTIENEIVVRFNRLVTEEQMEDFPAMVDFMIDTLKKLNEIVC